MRELPAGFPTDALVEALESNWNVSVRDVEYVPVGFWAHHWRATRTNGDDLFMSVHELDLVGRSRGGRDDNFEALRRALRTARWLACVVRLEFVLSPRVDLRGETVHRVEDAKLAALDRSDWVITHGDPRGANLIRTRDGKVRMIDWDSALVAPRERDLWGITPPWACAPDV